MGAAARAALCAALFSALLLTGCGIGCYKTYYVGRGEDIDEVCSRFEMTPDQLRKENHIEPGYELKSGDRIYIPCSNYEKKDKKKGDASKKSADADLPKPAAPKGGHLPGAKPPLSTEGGRESAKAPTPSASVRFAWPIEGEVLRGFSDGRDAAGNGLDVKASAGGSVRVAGNGKVEYAGTPANAYGPMILVSHGDGFYTVYSRLGAITVKKGQSLEKGALIGTAGAEGYIHFEVRSGKKAVDPVLYLPKQ